MKETITEAKVTYTLEVNGKFYIFENVPARICEETGEQFFSPEVVKHIQEIIKNQKKPSRMIQAPVYDFT